MSCDKAGADQFKHLRWRCRRGLKELDVMLERFLSQHFDKLSVSDKTCFAELLEQSDMDLLEWLTGKSSPSNDAFIPLLTKIRDS